VTGFCVAAEDASELPADFRPIGGGSQLQDLLDSGDELDPGDSGGALTRAGRSVTKHLDLFPGASGTPADYNAVGHETLEDILTNGQEVAPPSNYPGGRRFVGPNGVGATFDASGTFKYFGGYPVP
jgi:hypothetical protein